MFAIYEFAFPIHEAFIYEIKKMFNIDINYITTKEFLNREFTESNIFIFLVSYTVRKNDKSYLQKIYNLKTTGSFIIFYNDIELNMPDVFQKHIMKKQYNGKPIYMFYDQIWSYDLSHKDLITPLKLPFYYVPYGYSEYYENNQNCTKKYDFLFFGRTTKYGGYRKKQLEILKNAGLNIKIITDVYGDDLIHELKSSKIVLNIKSGENIIDLDFPRYSLLVGLDVFFITDAYNDKSGVESSLRNMFIFANSRKHMIDLALFYIQKTPEELKSITKYKYLTYKDTYSNYTDPLKYNFIFDKVIHH